jgi:YVTN family beta-propeller protein
MHHLAIGNRLVLALLVPALAGTAAAQQAQVRAAAAKGAQLPSTFAGVAAPVAPVVSTAVAPFPNFESGPVHPIVLSPDGSRLYALNTPDARLEVFATDVDAQGVPHLRAVGSVFTGLEPVSIALDPEHPHIAFVANLLSDTVAVVDLAQLAVVALIPAGDEPQDVVVTAGHVFVATSRSAPPSGTAVPGAFVDNAVVIADSHPPYAITARVGIQAHRPRALAVAGGTVYVVPEDSGNHTSVLDADQTAVMGLEQLMPDAFDPPITVNPTLLAPAFTQVGFLNTNFGVFGWAVPHTGRIVMDSEYPGLTPLLADRDVLAIDAASGTLLPDAATGVGSTLFAIERNPVTGELWVAATDAHNRTRFEPNVSGKGLDNRVVTVQTSGLLTALQTISLAPPTTAVAHAQPVALAFHDGPAGQYGYVATLGDDTVVVLDAFSNRVVGEIAVGAQPAGLAADPVHGLLYVLSRGDKTLRSFDVAHGHAPIGRVARLAYDPEPEAVALGRKFLYGAGSALGTGNGDMSCASCHIFGHMDQLAWDLGNPQGGLGNFYLDVMGGTLGFTGAKIAQKSSMMTHPMKGPMTTQSLRGLLAEGATPLHWRGDRRFLQMFRGAFVGLLGGSGLSPAQMQEFTAFVRTLTWPPNPHEPKDRNYVGTEAQGRDLFGMNPNVPGKEYNSAIPGNVTCIDCHKGNFSAGTDFTGSQPTVNFDGEAQMFNAAQLRGVYEKDDSDLTGFGTLHDGSLADIEEFLHFIPQSTGMAAFPLLVESEKQAVEDFVRAWDTGTAPEVGEQFFADASTSAPALDAWLGLAESQAALPKTVDLVGKAHAVAAGGPSFGLLFEPAATWRTDTGRTLPDATLRAAIAAGSFACTFTCVPAGLGPRLGIDRDEDGLLDGLELARGTNPADPDTDHDGYDDGLELKLGSNPLVFDAFVADGVAPTVQQASALDVFADTATLHALTDEPATLAVDVGLAAGSYDFGHFASDSLRRTHDVVLDGLPAGTPIFFRVTALDHNANAGTLEGSFTTAPPLFHLTSVTLEKSGSGTVTLTAKVTVVDQAGAPVNNVPVRGVWTGPLGGADFFPFQRTDATGVATFTIGPYAPTPGEVAFGVGYLGLNDTNDPFFIGLGGDEPTFFYNQSANDANYATVSVP